MPRDCSACEACCIVPSVENVKETNSVCPFLNQTKSCHKCKIYDKRPEPCASFECMWLQGYGDENSRPNQNGILTTIREFNNGVWLIAIETEADAVTNNGKSILSDLANGWDIPIIIQSYDSDIETGDKTIIKDSLLPRTTAMTGDFIRWIDNGIGLYHLINTVKE